MVTDAPERLPRQYRAAARASTTRPPVRLQHHWDLALTQWTRRTWATAVRGHSLRVYTPSSIGDGPDNMQKYRQPHHTTSPASVNQHARHIRLASGHVLCTAGFRPRSSGRPPGPGVPLLDAYLWVKTPGHSEMGSATPPGASCLGTIPTISQPGMAHHGVGPVPCSNLALVGATRPTPLLPETGCAAQTCPSRCAQLATPSCCVAARSITAMRAPGSLLT